MAGPVWGWACRDVLWWKAASPDLGAPAAGFVPGFLPPGLSWSLCGAASPVWQCLAALAPEFGPSLCQEWCWLIDCSLTGSRTGARRTLQGEHAQRPSHRGVGSASRQPLLHTNHRWKERAWIFFFFLLINGSAVRHFFPGILSLSLPGRLNELFSLRLALTFLRARPRAAGRDPRVGKGLRAGEPPAPGSFSSLN